MLRNLISAMWDAAVSAVPIYVNEKYFLYVIGSIFLLGAATKRLASFHYGRMIRKAENMTNPKNKTLRQIKTKFDGIKEVSGTVANTELMVRRQISQCSVFGIQLKKLSRISDRCVIIITAVSGLAGWAAYHVQKQEADALFYLFAGCFAAFVLERINRNAGIHDRRKELTYVIADFLENSAVARADRRRDNTDETDGSAGEPDESPHKNTEQNDSVTEEEKILNNVIGEFL